MFSVMMYLETDPRAGINIGTSISVTETYHESFFNKSSTHILYRLHWSLVLLSSFMVLNRLSSMPHLFKWHSGTNYLIGQHIRSLWKFIMGHQEYKCGSRYMLIAAHQTTLLKVKSAATLGGKETSFAGNVMLVGHMKWKNLMKDFIVCLRWAMIRILLLVLTKQNIQPGDPRSAEETILDIQYQVQLACLGISQNVKN